MFVSFCLAYSPVPSIIISATNMNTQHTELERRRAIAWTEDEHRLAIAQLSSPHFSLITQLYSDHFN